FASIGVFSNPQSSCEFCAKYSQTTSRFVWTILDCNHSHIGVCHQWQRVQLFAVERPSFLLALRLQESPPYLLYGSIFFENYTVTLASTIIYAYWWLVPLGIVMFLYMRSKRAVSGSRDGDQDPLMDYSDAGTRNRRSGVMQPRLFVDFLSVYGYALAIFVPVSILWAIPSTFFQWFLVIFAMAISGAFLTFALFPTFRREHQKLAGPLVVGLIVIHCVFSIGLMLTFFHGTSTLPNQLPHTKGEPVLSQEILKPAEVKEVKREIAEPLVKLPIDVAVDSPSETNRSGINA
ncbi:uncharacterized protein DEA37_0013616, partial [Paragonimus westermani]